MQTAFEVCVTSNYQSGAVPGIKAHPLSQMISEGLNVTINTDDPSISQIKLSDEYRLSCEVLNISLTQLKQRVLAAAQASFLPPGERQILTRMIEKEFPALTD